MRPRALWILVAYALSITGCQEPLIDGTFTSAEWMRVQTLSPLPALAPDPTNAVADDPRAALFGQMLFFERDYSGPIEIGDDGTNGGLGPVGATGLVSCASCHDPSATFDDTRSMPDATSLGVRWTDRNAPTLINAAYYDYFDWDGHADTLWSQALGPLESEMGGDRVAIAHVVFAQYRDVYDPIFDPDLDPALDPTSADASRFPPHAMPGSASWDAMSAADRDIVDRIYANVGKAIEAYERLLVTRESPFDRYVAGDSTAISPAARRGLALFIGPAACVHCHSGPFFTDEHFHDLGVPQRGLHVPASDLGRFTGVDLVLADPFDSAGAFSDDPASGMARLAMLTSSPALRGAFRTKSLREISLTAPYMHDGAFATLHDVIDFYDDGGGTAPTHGTFDGTVDPLLRPLGLADRDYDDLVAFLETLAGDPIAPALLVDVSR